MKHNRYEYKTIKYYDGKNTEGCRLLKGDRPSAGGSHMSGVQGREKPRQAFPLKICGEAASNPRPGDSVRQLSPLHQACPSGCRLL